MIGKDRIFKRGDVIVSGLGNVRIFTGECYDGSDVCYKALAPYCESDAPAGTDMRYARHATAREKNRFFQVLSANGLVYDAKSCTITATEDFDTERLERYVVKRYNGKPLPFKVVKKRVHPTLSQIRVLEAKVRLLDEVINTHCKEKVELKDHLADVKACNEKYANELRRLESDNQDLRERNATKDQSIKLMEEELDRVRKKLGVAEAGWQEAKEEVERLYNRGFWARVFNW